MSQKVNSLDEAEKKEIKNHIESISATLGMDAYESYGSNPEQKKLKQLLGMCCDCDNLSYCATEFGNIHAVCTMFNFKMSGQNRIVECNEHSPKNVLSLSEMYSIATLIDVEKEHSVGFTAQVKSKKDIKDK